MSKRNKWHSSSTGKAFEDRICKELDELGIEYIREKIAHSKSTAKTNRGKFDLIIGDLRLELKTTQKKSLSYSIYSECEKNTNIKGHQVAALYKEFFSRGKTAGLLLEYRPNKAIYVDIKDFMAWAIQTKAKSLNYANALLIGKEIEHIKELIE